MTTEAETTLDNVTSVLNRWYFRRVRGDAKDFADRIRANEWTDADAVNEALREYCDDADIIIYTYQAKLVYVASDNASNCDSEIEDMGCEATATAEMRAAICLRLDLEETIPAFLECSIEQWFDAHPAE